MVSPIYLFLRLIRAVQPGRENLGFQLFPILKLPQFQARDSYETETGGVELSYKEYGISALRKSHGSISHLRGITYSFGISLIGALVLP